jgi:TonB family protein
MNLPGPALSPSELRTALSPARQPLLGYVGCSVLIHLTMLGIGAASPLFVLIAALFPSCRDEPPMETIEVSMVSLPKSDKSVPDRAARVRAEAGTVADTPPPVKESDLVVHQDVPDPDPGNTEEDRRKALLEEIERRRLLAELENAPDGPRDRDPSDPNGTAKSLEDAVLGAQAQGDPEFARWMKQVQDLLQSKFHPLGTASGIDCVVTIRMDVTSGAVDSYEVTRGSGALAFDSAAERAVADTPKLPLPPEKFRSIVERGGVPVRFSPP